MSYSGFHAMATLKKHPTTPHGSQSTPHRSQSTQESEAVATPLPVLDTPSRVSSRGDKSSTVPDVFIFCTFFDGGVGLYDLQHSSWAFIRDKVLPKI